MKELSPKLTTQTNRMKAAKSMTVDLIRTRSLERWQVGALLQAKKMSRTMISLQSNGMPRIILCLSLSMLASPLGNSTNQVWSEKRMAVAMK